MEMKMTHAAFESKEKDYLYKIGMFAAMNHVTVKTLRFYESQGLLSPAYVDEENGYRYYTMSQMSVVHQISALKQAGFTLEDIARINSGSSASSFLTKKKAELMAQIAKLTEQISVIDGYLSEEDIHLDTPVLIKTIPAVTIVAMQDRIQSYDALFDMMPEMGALMEEAGCECDIPEYCFTSYPEPGFKSEDILVETCQAVTRMQPNYGKLTFKELPEIQAACIFHKGSYAAFSKTYETVLRFIEENNYVITGEIREKYIDGIWNKDQENEWLSEIQIPITKRTEDK